MNGDGRINTTSLLEQRSHSSSGSLGRAENDIYVGRADDSSVLGVNDGETMREVEGFALGLIHSERTNQLAA